MRGKKKIKIDKKTRVQCVRPTDGITKGVWYTIIEDGINNILLEDDDDNVQWYEKDRFDMPQPEVSGQLPWPKVGDVVACLANTLGLGLTSGKYYNVHRVDQHTHTIWVRNDKGVKMEYPRTYFTLDVEHARLLVDKPKADKGLREIVASRELAHMRSARLLEECLKEALSIIEDEYREEMENKDWLGTGSNSRAAEKEKKECLESIDRRVAHLRVKAGINKKD